MPVTPLEWELLLAVVLDVAARVETLSERAKEHGFDNRLLTRLMREGRVDATTEEAVGGALEPPADGADGSRGAGARPPRLDPPQAMGTRDEVERGGDGVPSGAVCG